jgi:hypothetical protein
VVNSQIKASSPERVAYPAFLETTKGIVSAFTGPSFGMLSCQTLNNSSSIASNAWSTLSNLVDQQHASLGVLQRPQQWTGTEKVQAVKLLLARTGLCGLAASSSARAVSSAFSQLRVLADWRITLPSSSVPCIHLGQRQRR